MQLSYIDFNPNLPKCHQILGISSKLTRESKKVSKKDCSREGKNDSKDLEISLVFWDQRVRVHHLHKAKAMKVNYWVCYCEIALVEKQSN